MKIDDIRLLYDYNSWANRRILAAAAAVSEAQLTAEPEPRPGYGSLRRVLLHTLDTEYGWRMICQHGTITPDLSEETFPTVAAIAARWREEEAALDAYLAGLGDDDMTSIVSYTTGEGVQRNRVLWHCLWHVVNHGTQHRSEAAALLTSYGASPGDVDFTLFLNERAARQG
jgi:uncharacterized damage-inducible protein DinB